MEFKEFVHKFFPPMVVSPHSEHIIKLLTERKVDQKLIINTERRVDNGIHARLMYVDDLKQWKTVIKEKEHSDS
jgi:hypothetical protein